MVLLLALALAEWWLAEFFLTAIDAEMLCVQSLSLSRAAAVSRRCSRAWLNRVCELNGNAVSQPVFQISPSNASEMDTARTFSWNPSPPAGGVVPAPVPLSIDVFPLLECPQE